MRSGGMFTLYTLAFPALPIGSFDLGTRRERLGEANGTMGTERLGGCLARF